MLTKNIISVGVCHLPLPVSRVIEKGKNEGCLEYLGQTEKNGNHNSTMSYSL